MQPHFETFTGRAEPPAGVGPPRDPRVPYLQIWSSGSLCAVTRGVSLLLPGPPRGPPCPAAQRGTAEEKEGISILRPKGDDPPTDPHRCPDPDPPRRCSRLPPPAARPGGGPSSPPPHLPPRPRGHNAPPFPPPRRSPPPHTDLRRGDAAARRALLHRGRPRIRLHDVRPQRGFGGRQDLVQFLCNPKQTRGRQRGAAAEGQLFTPPPPLEPSRTEPSPPPPRRGTEWGSRSRPPPAPHLRGAQDPPRWGRPCPPRCSESAMLRVLMLRSGDGALVVPNEIDPPEPGGRLRWAQPALSPGPNGSVWAFTGRGEAGGGTAFSSPPSPALRPGTGAATHSSTAGPELSTGGRRPRGRDPAAPCRRGVGGGLSRGAAPDPPQPRSPHDVPAPLRHSPGEGPWAEHRVRGTAEPRLGRQRRSARFHPPRSSGSAFWPSTPPGCPLR